ncbi:MAG: hypothetical protein PHX30_04270 [Candidatus Pacebacteria bacterium]|nr:hypothetical protein [Candidatus Paceibacterota bacterium]
MFIFPVVALLLLAFSLLAAGSGVPGDDPDYISDKDLTVAPEDAKSGFNLTPELEELLDASTMEMERPHIGIKDMRVKKTGHCYMTTVKLAFLGQTWNNTYAGGKNITTWEPGEKITIKFFSRRGRPYSITLDAIRFEENEYLLKVALYKKASRIKIYVGDEEILSQKLPIRKITLHKGDLEITDVFRSGENSIAFNMTSEKFSGKRTSKKTSPVYAVIYTGAGEEKIFYRQTYLFEAGPEHPVSPKMSISNFNDCDWTVEVRNIDGEIIAEGELRQPLQN